MSGFDVVTSSDHDYAFFLPGLSWSVSRFLNTQLVVYDLGLEGSTLNSVDAKFVSFHQLDNSYKEMNSERCIKAIHKPACILDWLSKARRPFIFLDADCLVVAPFFFPRCDLGFTFRHYSDQTADDFRKNGLINAGVIFLNPTNETSDFLFRFVSIWKERCESDIDSTDQIALSNIILEEFDFVPGKWLYKFNTNSIYFCQSELYNDVKLSTGFIYHFKCSCYQKEKKNNYLKKLYFIQNYPFFIKIIVYYNRFVLYFKRLLRPKKYKFRYKSAWNKFLRNRIGGS